MAALTCSCMPQVARRSVLAFTARGWLGWTQSSLGAPSRCCDLIVGPKKTLPFRCGGMLGLLLPFSNKRLNVTLPIW